MGDWLSSWERLQDRAKGRRLRGWSDLAGPGGFDLEIWRQSGDYGVAKKGDLSVFLTAERHP